MYYDDYEDYTLELPEYMEAIQSAVDAEVERRLAETVKDLDTLREVQNSYEADRECWHEQIYESDKRRHEAERKLEQMEKEKESAINEAKSKKIEELFDGWHKDDMCYIVEYGRSYPSCPVCDGELNIIVPVAGVGTSVKVDCPCCQRGQKREWPEYKMADVQHFLIENPLVAMNEKTGKVYPAAYCHNYDFQGIKDLTVAFHTREEAEAFAEQHNKEELEKCNVKLMEYIHNKGMDGLLPENRKKETKS